MRIENSNFIFIIGAPRSGTTWLHKMISAHEDVFSLNGSNTFLQVYIFPLENIYNREKTIFADKGFTRGLPSKLSESQFLSLMTDFIKRFYEILPRDKKYYVEKATDLTSEIHKIKKYIPYSKFVHIIRDGRNETISEIKLRKKYGAPFGSKDVYTGAMRWKKQVEEARMNSSNFLSDVIEIKYEDLLKNTEFFLEKIFKHIGLNCEKKDIIQISEEYHYKNSKVSNPTTEVADSKGNPFKAFAKEMNIFEQALFEHIAGDLLESLGYKTKKLMNNPFYYVYVNFLYIPFYHLKRIILSILRVFVKKINIFKNGG